MDLKMSVFHTVVNSLAGGNAVPRPARAGILRLMGIRTKSANIYSGSRFTSSNVTIGRGTFVNHECYLDAATGEIRIGEDCMLAAQVMILATTHERDAAGNLSRKPRNAVTVIGDRVWLGARSTVLPGVHVGDDCVIAAGAVVTKNCAPGRIYAGVPAQPMD